MRSNPHIPVCIRMTQLLHKEKNRQCFYLLLSTFSSILHLVHQENSLLTTTSHLFCKLFQPNRERPGTSTCECVRALKETLTFVARTRGLKHTATAYAWCSLRLETRLLLMTVICNTGINNVGNMFACPVKKRSLD